MSGVNYTVEFKVRDGSMDEFTALANECSAIAERDEPGTVGYEWTINDDGVCHLHERFPSSEDALAHLGGPIVSDVLPKILEHSELVTIDVYGDPSAEFLEAAAALPVRQFENLAGFSR